MFFVRYAGHDLRQNQNINVPLPFQGDVMEITKEDIREYIYDQSCRSSQVLSEREIAEQFSIKRGRARELLLELVGQGVVERRPRSGYSYVDYRRTSMDSILLLRFIVEEDAAVKALKRASAVDKENLIHAHEKLVKAASVNDLAAFAAADLEFHTCMVCASHDNMLINIFDFLRSTLFRRSDWNNLLPPNRLQATLLIHSKILDSFLKNDERAFIALIKRHLGYHKLNKRLRELAEPIPEEFCLKETNCSGENNTLEC